MGIWGDASEEAITNIGFITQDLLCTEAEQHIEEEVEELEEDKTIIWIILITFGGVVVLTALIVAIVQCCRKRGAKKVQNIEVQKI